MKSKPWWIALLASLAFAGGGARTTYAGAPARACSLLTPTQVGAALGMKVGAGETLMAKVCIWPGAAGKEVTLNLINPRAFAAAKMPIGNGIIKTEVSAVGDDAVYVSSHGAPTTLTVKKVTPPSLLSSSVFRTI